MHAGSMLYVKSQGISRKFDTWRLWAELQLFFNQAGDLKYGRREDGAQEGMEIVESAGGVAAMLKGPSRSIKANVLWLDANPDAKQALLAEPAGKGKVRAYARF